MSMARAALSRAMCSAAVLLAACGAPVKERATTRGSSVGATPAPVASVSERVESARARGDWPSVLLALAEAGNETAHGELADQAVDAASLAELESVAGRMALGRFPRNRVELRLGLLYEHMGRTPSATESYQRVRGPLQGEARARAQQLKKLRSVGRGRRVAVLLPLSGPYAALGRELRAAVELAADEGRGFDAVFVDSEGDDGVAARRVDEAADAHDVVAVLGPVGDRESRAAAARAAQRGIPIALLGPGASEPAEGVFRLVSSPTWEAKAAAKTAKLLGFASVAVLAPRDEHGEAAAVAFSRVAAALGLRVVADGRYDPTTTELEPDIKAFFGLDPAKNERLRRHLRRHGTKQGWKSFSPDVHFELLFIPDAYRRASLVASYLPYFNIEVRTRDLMNTYALRRKHGGRLPSVVQLLGPSSWHHPALIPAGGRAVDGAFVLDAFVGGASEDFAYEEAALFATAYERRTGRPPSQLAAQAFDAAALVAVAVKAAPAGDRLAVMRSLSRAHIAAGACGPARVGPSREVERQPIVLRVEGGEFELHEY